MALKRNRTKGNVILSEKHLKVVESNGQVTSNSTSWSELICADIFDTDDGF